MDMQLMPSPSEEGKTKPRRANRVGSLLKQSAQEWSADEASNQAAALSFYTLFSISPLLVVAIAVAGLLYGRDATEPTLDRLEAIMGSQAVDAVRTILKNTSAKATGIFATGVGLVGVILGASGVFGHLQSSLNRIWKVRPKPGRGIRGVFFDRLVSFGLVVGIGVMLLASLVATTTLSAMGETLTRYLPFSSLALQSFNFGVSLAVTTLLFALLFKTLPDARVHWRDLWVGALATALMFSLGRFLIGLYLGRGSVASPYGAAGSLVVLLLWVYYSAQVLFFGAELTQVYANRVGSGVIPRKHAEKIAGKAG